MSRTEIQRGMRLEGSASRRAHLGGGAGLLALLLVGCTRQEPPTAGPQSTPSTSGGEVRGAPEADEGEHVHRSMPPGWPLGPGSDPGAALPPDNLEQTSGSELQGQAEATDTVVTEHIHRPMPHGWPQGSERVPGRLPPPDSPQPWMGIQPRPPSTRPRLESRPAGLDALPIRLREVGSEVGLRFRWPALTGDPPYMTDMMGQGAGWLDYDQDGWMDVLLVADAPQLYRNLGNGRFAEATSALGEVPVGPYRSAAVGDLNGDGFPDLYLSGYRHDRLLINVRGKFGDASQQWGVSQPIWSSSAAFADLDLDGDLDLIVGGYLEYDQNRRAICEYIDLRDECGPQFYKPEKPRVLANEGSRFRDVTKQWGFEAANGRNLGILTRDLDGDGRLEVVFANDSSPGDLFVMSEAARVPGAAPFFENRGVMSGLAYDYTGQVHAGMGIDAADTNHDGRLDLAVMAMYQEGASLYEAKGPLQYKDLGYLRGVTAFTWPHVGFGAVFVDVDNNGASDLVIANGHILTQAERCFVGSTYRQPMQLLYNRDGVFWEQNLGLEGLPGPIAGRALAVADYDHDGRPDLLVSQLEGKVLLLHNEGDPTAHWLSVRPLRRSGLDAHGVFLSAQVGAETRVLSHRIEGSYLSMHEPWSHLGLGKATRVDRVTIVWGPGRQESFGPFDANQRVILREGAGQSSSTRPPSATASSPDGSSRTDAPLSR